MSIRQWDRREALRGELLDLIVEMMALGRTAEGQNTPEFRRLDQELIQIFLIVALFACLFFLSEGLRGSSELLGIAVFGLLYSCVCIAWVTYILCRYKPE